MPCETPDSAAARPAGSDGPACAEELIIPLYAADIPDLPEMPLFSEYTFKGSMVRLTGTEDVLAVRLENLHTGAVCDLIYDEQADAWVCAEDPGIEREQYALTIEMADRRLTVNNGSFVTAVICEEGEPRYEWGYFVEPLEGREDELFSVLPCYGAEGERLARTMYSGDNGLLDQYVYVAQNGAKVRYDTPMGLFYLELERDGKLYGYASHGGIMDSGWNVFDETVGRYGKFVPCEAPEGVDLADSRR